MNPTKLTRLELLAFLDEMRAAVVADDSFGGFVEYEADSQDTYTVRGTYRYGNRMGQGSIAMVGTLDPAND